MAKKKHLTAEKVYKYLTKLKNEGHDLNQININYRHDLDSDVERVSSVQEDLYDSKKNSTLESIVFVTK